MFNPNNHKKSNLMKLFVIAFNFLKKTQNCPKSSVFDQKTPVSWSIFPIKKRKTVPCVSFVRLTKHPRAAPIVHYEL